MNESVQEPKGCLRIAAFVGIFVVVFVFSCIGPRMVTDREVDTLCKTDGGIRVFQTGQLDPGESFIPNDVDKSTKDDGRSIGKNFWIKKSHRVWMLRGVSEITKETTWIERKFDSMRLSEMTKYARYGGEGFGSKICPPNLSENDLIAQTLTASVPNPP